MRPIVITGIIVAFAAGWAATVTFIIPGSLLVKLAITFFGALAMGVIVALVLRRRWLRMLKAKKGGQDQSAILACERKGSRDGH